MFKSMILTDLIDYYLDDFELDSVVSIFRTFADRLDHSIDEQSVSLSIFRRGRLALLITTIIWAVSIEEIVAEHLLDTVKELLDETGQLRLNRHLKDVKVLVSAKFLILRISLDLFYSLQRVSVRYEPVWFLNLKQILTQCFESEDD